jgi:methyltransferase (TIGR00027 family)
VRQYVILGAGLDTFAYRQPEWARDLGVLEVDYAASQADKRDRLKRAGLGAPPNLRYAAVDLEANDLSSALMAAGLDITKPAVVACLGVLIYLSEGAADAIFATAARLAAGSEFIFTFSRPDASTARPPSPASAASRMAAIGEPWRTRFDPGALAAKLESSGFSSIGFLFAQDITERYLSERNDGLRAPSRVVLADATV